MNRKLVMELTDSCKEDEKSYENAEKLVDLLKRNGIQASLSRNGVIKLSWKDKDTDKSQRRHAGRKEISLDMESVMVRRKTETLTTIAANLGIGRSTLYRRIRDYEKEMAKEK